MKLKLQKEKLFVKKTCLILWSENSMPSKKFVVEWSESASNDLRSIVGDADNNLDRLFVQI